MKYRNTIIALGVAIVVIEFLGFPSSWNNAIYAILGIAVIAFAYLGK